MKALAAITLAALPVSAGALDLPACERAIAVHGGEKMHRDAGAGRVVYAEWWSNEGVYHDVIVADCASGAFLKTRTQEERIKDRLPFDRTGKAMGIIDRELTASPSLFSFDRLADVLDGTGRDIEIADLASEPCACAVLYPELRGPRTQFEGIQ